MGKYDGFMDFDERASDKYTRITMAVFHREREYGYGERTFGPC